MAIVTRSIDYLDAGTTLGGVLAYDDSASSPRPAVLVSHAWGGQDDFARGMAVKLAELGYVGFALDMYGKGVLKTSVPDCSALITPFMADRRLIAHRQQLALATVRAQNEVDGSRIAAIGFCFGGLCVLDLARDGADVRGVVAFHALLKGSGLPAKKISAKALVLHGDADPLAPLEDLLAFREEFNAAGADWQAHMYGHTGHAFAVPGAFNPELGVAHNAVAERRSMQAMRDFLAEVLA